MLPSDSSDNQGMSLPSANREFTPSRPFLVYHNPADYQGRLFPPSPLRATDRPQQLVRRPRRSELDRSRLGSAGEGSDRPSLPVTTTACAARRLTSRALRRSHHVIIKRVRLRRRLRSTVAISGRAANQCRRTSSLEDDTVFQQCDDDISKSSVIFNDRVPSSSQQQDELFFDSISRPGPTTTTVSDSKMVDNRLQQRASSSQTTVFPSNQANAFLPADPREWSRRDVCNWLLHMRRLYNVPDLDVDKFQMNGKALCIMTPAMFTFRVPSTGLTLYSDFQTRFQQAVMRQLHNGGANSVHF